MNIVKSTKAIITIQYLIIQFPPYSHILLKLYIAKYRTFHTANCRYVFGLFSLETLELYFNSYYYIIIITLAIE